MATSPPPVSRPLDALMRAADVHAELELGETDDELEPAPSQADEPASPAAPASSPKPTRKRGPAK